MTKRMRRSLGILSLCCLPTVMAFSDIPVTYTINTNEGRVPISPYIYGANPSMTGAENLTVRRSGGNRGNNRIPLHHGPAI